MFLAVDSMKARKEIFKGALKFNPRVKLMVEMRLGIEFGMIYTVDPSNPQEVKKWESKWYSDEEAQASPCTERMIGTTVATVAGICVHHLILWHNKEDYPQEVTVNLGKDKLNVISWDPAPQAQEVLVVTT